MEANESHRPYAVLLVLVMGLWLLVTAFVVNDYGMGWDEKTRWQSGDQKLEYYWQLAVADDRAAVVESTGMDPYPGLFDLPLAFFHHFTGWDRFLLGHLWSAVFATVGLLAAAACAFRFGGAKAAFWTVLFLILTPSFFGHAFHNPKDIPMAATYMLAVAAVVRWADCLPRFSWPHCLLAGIACGLAMATRIAGLVTLCFAAAVAGFVILRALTARSDEVAGSRGVRACLIVGASLAVVITVAFLTLIPWWPAAHKNVFSVSGSTLGHLHSSASEIPLLFRGEVLAAGDAPFYYTLWMLAIKTPLFLSALLCFGVGGLLLRLKSWQETWTDRDTPAWLVLSLAALFPVAYLTYKSPALHNGMRHVLFVLPAMAVFAALGWCSLERHLKASGTRALSIGRGILAVALAVAAANIVLLHPYQYTYFNLIAGGTAGSLGNYETEYWYTSSRHALEWLGEHGKSPDEGLAHVFIVGPWQVAVPFLPEGYELTHDVDGADYIVANTQMMMHTLFNGNVLHVIQRMGLPICYIYEGPSTGVVGPKTE